jgi:hypothetical protein
LERGWFITKIQQDVAAAYAPDYRQTHPGLHLGDSHQKQHQLSDQHVGADTIILGVINRPQREAAFQPPEGAIHKHEFP